MSSATKHEDSLQEEKKVVSDDTFRSVLLCLAGGFEDENRKKEEALEGLLKMSLLTLSDYLTAGGTMESFISGAKKILQEISQDE